MSSEADVPKSTICPSRESLTELETKEDMMLTATTRIPDKIIYVAGNTNFPSLSLAKIQHTKATRTKEETRNIFVNWNGTEGDGMKNIGNKNDMHNSNT